MSISQGTSGVNQKALVTSREDELAFDNRRAFRSIQRGCAYGFGGQQPGGDGERPSLPTSGPAHVRSRGLSTRRPSGSRRFFMVTPPREASLIRGIGTSLLLTDEGHGNSGNDVPLRGWTNAEQGATEGATPTTGRTRREEFKIGGVVAHENVPCIRSRGGCSENWLGNL